VITREQAQTAVPAATAQHPPVPAPGAPPPPPPHPRSSKRRRAVALGALVVLGAAIALRLLLHGAGAAAAPFRATGTVEATEAVLGFAAAGRIAEVRVHEGDRTTAGAVLALLDTAQAMARMRQAQANVAVARAQLADLQYGSRPQELEDRRQALMAAQQTLAQATADWDRVRTLTNAVSEQSIDAARTARDVAQARYEQARQELALAEAGTRRGQVAAAAAAVDAAQAQAHLIEATIPDYFVRSPFDGIVTVRAREPGESVVPGNAVVSVLNPADRWVRIYIPESRLGLVHIGEAAAISIDAFPRRAFSGEVSWISSEAEFTPRNVQTQDERVKLVYAAKIRITNDPELALKPGTPADVRLLTVPSAGR